MKKKDIERLKEFIKVEFGGEILTRGHCEDLAIEITRKTGYRISYNTLRRIFNLAGNDVSLPSRSTLDILSKYVGLRDFAALELGLSVSKKGIASNYKLLLFLSRINSLNSHQKMELLKELEFDEHWAIYFKQFVEIAMDTGDEEFISSFFSDAYFFNNRSYLDYYLYHGMQYLGVTLRQKLTQQLTQFLTSNNNARKFYLEMFVDMDHLMNGHHLLLRRYYESSLDSQDKLFSASLIYFHEFLKGRSKFQDLWLNRIREELNLKIHPIPLARALCALMIDESNRLGKVSPALKRLILKAMRSVTSNQLENGSRDMFFLWLLQGAVLTRDWRLAKTCIIIIEKLKPEKLSYSEIGSYEVFKVHKAMVLFHQKEIEKSNDIFISISKNSFYSFSYLFDSIFLFALEFQLLKSSDAQKEGQKLARSLGYQKLWRMLIE